MFGQVDAKNPGNRRGVIDHALSTRTGRNKLRPYKKWLVRQGFRKLL
jgi:hypothetical protein